MTTSNFFLCIYAYGRVGSNNSDERSCIPTIRSYAAHPKRTGGRPVFLWKSRGCVIMAHLGRRPRASGSVIDLSQLPSPSPSGSYHLNHSDSTLSIRMPKRRWSNFDTTPFDAGCGLKTAQWERVISRLLWRRYCPGDGCRGRWRGFQRGCPGG